VPHSEHLSSGCDERNLHGGSFTALATRLSHKLVGSVGDPFGKTATANVCFSTGAARRVSHPRMTLLDRKR
ncbi:MAG: hypothetical protein ACREHD_10125, partial [Pirellulales bacterium]